MNIGAAELSPCQRCGACCAAYRVSFYWGEAESQGLPDALSEQRDPHHLCMKGTSQPSPHCAALAGAVGHSVSCTVYAQRPSPCRDLQVGDAMCNRARALHGLVALPDSAATVKSPAGR